MAAPLDFDESDGTSTLEATPLIRHSFNQSANSSTFGRIMEKWNSSRMSRFFDKIAVQSESGLTNAQLMLANEDLKPVEPGRRQWKSWNYVFFWISDSFNINTWMIASTNITDGLTWWQSWICVWIGYSMAACFVCLTGRIGARYHISFPVASRASFGIWGSLWPVLNRAGMACIWYGVQAWIGGTCVQLMISSIWRSWDSYATGQPNNSMPYSGTSIRDYVSFFLFWLGSLPFLWFPIHKIRHLFTVKSAFVPVAGVSFFIWAIVRAHGIGPIMHEKGTLHGSPFAWAIIKGIMSSIANFAALIVNDPDFSRFARKPSDALWSQLFTIPIGFAVTCFVGIIVSSSSVVIFGGDPIWSPLTLLQKFLDEPNVSGATRFGVFVIAAAFTLAQLGTNIAANSIAAGTDMSALFPRYVNIRRGSYICAAVGLVICPWNLLKTSNNFTTYLSAYSVFLSSIAGVIICDYYWVRKGYLQTRDLYNALRTGPYYYNWGISWRAYAAYISGILINVVGFAGAVGLKVPIVATYIFNLNYFCGFLVAFFVYALLCRFFPIPATSDVWMEVDEDTTGMNNSLVYGIEDESVDDEQNYMPAGKGDLPKR